jgi:hypothetical protein
MSEQFNMADIDVYADRAVEKITILARKAARFATAILAFVVVACVGSFLLGWAALDDSRNVWLVLGGFFGVWALGAALLGRWRIGSVNRHLPGLATELRGLLSQGRSAGSHVIEAFVVEEADGNSRFAARLDNAGAVGLGRTMWGFKGAVGTGTQAFGRLTATVTALTSYPVLALVAVLISLVFLALVPVFLLLLVF